MIHTRHKGMLALGAGWRPRSCRHRSGSKPANPAHAQALGENPCACVHSFVPSFRQAFYSAAGRNPKTRITSTIATTVVYVALEWNRLSYEGTIQHVIRLHRLILGAVSSLTRFLTRLIRLVAGGIGLSNDDTPLVADPLFRGRTRHHFAACHHHLAARHHLAAACHHPPLAAA